MLTFANLRLTFVSSSIRHRPLPLRAGAGCWAGADLAAQEAALRIHPRLHPLPLPRTHRRRRLLQAGLQTIPEY